MIRIKRSLANSKDHPEVMSILERATLAEMMPTHFPKVAYGRKLFEERVRAFVYDLLQDLARGLHIDVTTSYAPCSGKVEWEAWVYIRVWTPDARAATLAYTGEVM